MFNLCSIENYENKLFKNNRLSVDTVTENPRVSGSIPFLGTFLTPLKIYTYRVFVGIFFLFFFR